MKISSAIGRILAVSVLMAVSGFAVAQQAYPSRQIRLIVPFSAGGGTDILARLLGPKLTESWGQQVLVDNRPGASTVIGSEALVKAPPDGHTIILVSNAHVINALLIANLPYDTIKDFAPVATVNSNGLILVLHPSIPANNLQAFIALAKSKPGELNYASTGSGGVLHLAGELFNMIAGVKMQHIPYKGSGQALTDLVGGQVQVFFNTPISSIPHVKSGKLKAIAISGETRMSAMPQVPTFVEAGLPGFDMKAWYGVLAPAGTPKAVVDKLSAEIARILSAPDIKEKLAAQGTNPYISTPDQFAALIKADMGRFAVVVKTANIRIQ